MATDRSFAEYVKNKCYNGLYKAAEEYVERNWQSMNLYTRNVHKVGEVEMSDATIQRVYRIYQLELEADCVISLCVVSKSVFERFKNIVPFYQKVLKEGKTLAV